MIQIGKMLELIFKLFMKHKNVFLKKNKMENIQENNPLHGYTLETILTYLHGYYGWEKLYDQTPINCFKSNPSIKSSLTFLRKTPWARVRLENTFVYITRKGIDPKLLVIKEKKKKEEPKI